MTAISTSYALIRPTVGDVLVAVHRAHGPNAATVWAKMLKLSGLAGHETDDNALHRLLEAMAGLDPVSRICARSMRVRLSTYERLAAANSPFADTTGSPA